VLEATAGGSTIVLIDVATGDAIREIDSALEIGASIAWSPDGELFAVEARDSGGGLGAGIYVMGTDGSEPRLVSSCPDAGCTDLEPAWSPDGTMLAFTRARCDDPGSDCFTGDIAVVAVGGGRVRTVTSERPLDCCAAWGTGNT
jgi:Tol biopolymer transport system component